MKKILLLCLAVIGLQIVVSAQVLYATDFGADTVGNRLSGQRGWSNSSTTNFPGIGDCAGAVCDRATVSNVALATPTGVTYNGSAKSITFGVNFDGVGHFFTTNNTLPNTTISNLTFADNESVYVSFLVRFSAVPTSLTTGQVIRILSAPDQFSVGMRLYVQKDATNKVRFGIEKDGGATYSPYSYDLNVTYLIVMKCLYVNGAANNVVSLYVNPTGTTEPATPVISTAAGTDYNLGRFVMYCNQAGTPTGNLTSIKVTKSWASLFTGVGTKELVANDVFHLEPNPANNFTTLRLAAPLAQNANYRLLDLNGRVMEQGIIAAGESQKTLSTAQLPKGFYSVNIQTNEGVATQKLVVQ
jgi:hypothetical protein